MYVSDRRAPPLFWWNTLWPSCHQWANSFQIEIYCGLWMNSTHSSYYFAVFSPLAAIGWEIHSNVTRVTYRRTGACYRCSHLHVVLMKYIFILWGKAQLLMPWIFKFRVNADVTSWRAFIWQDEPREIFLNVHRHFNFSATSSCLGNSF